MLKFFRKIRQDLIIKDNSRKNGLPGGKYFKYALGEIILVVIGILIALQINNWNNQRLTQQQMNSFLLSLKEDIKIDTMAFNHRIQFFNNIANKKKNLLSLTNFNQLSADSIYAIILPRVSNYTLNNSTYTKITNSGITQISENVKLSKKIYTYYTLLAESLNGFMLWDQNSSTTDGNYWHYGQNQFEINLDSYPVSSDQIVNFQKESIKKQHLVQLLSAPLARNHLKLAYTRKVILASEVKKFKKLATELIGEIENELSKNE